MGGLGVLNPGSPHHTLPIIQIKPGEGLSSNPGSSVTIPRPFYTSSERGWSRLVCLGIVLVQYSEHFGDRLADAVKSKRSSVCVGLDPRLKSLPQTLLSGLNMQDPVAVATTVCTFCKEVIDAVADIVPVVKPQAAFFELLGPQGMASLAEVVRYASTKGLLVLMDGKRGDIGTTAEAYADAYLGAGARSPWGCDALTVNPYMGEETLEPFSDRAQMSGSGIFVQIGRAHV